MRFLIDECLTVDLVAIAIQAGHEAWHIARLGKAGWKDWNVTRYAVDEGLVLVTNNAGDFRRLYATEPIHAGLIIIIPNINRVMQRQLFHGALEELATWGDPMNHVLEVDVEGDDVTLEFYDQPH